MSAGLVVVRPGPSVTVQDLGRPGYQRFGVSEGGAVDRRAHMIGAAVVGHPPECASLEMTMVGGTYTVTTEARDAVVTGALMPVAVDGVRVPHGVTFRIGVGATIEIGAATQGVYAYLTIGGGVETPPILGSRSTHTRARLGGLDGSVLQAGDILPIGAHAVSDETRRFGDRSPDAGPIRIRRGLHFDRFPPSVRDRLASEQFMVGSHRDRMGMRLDLVNPLVSSEALSLPSSPIVAGDIQVTGDGNPVVLLADHQPTGGYPRIATVIASDLARMAQTQSGTGIRFSWIDDGEATRLHRLHLAGLEAITENVSNRSEALLDANLISGFTVGEEESE